MYISHLVMKGQRHNNPFNPHCFYLQRPKRAHAIVEAFKLVTIMPKTVREMTQLLRET